MSSPAVASRLRPLRPLVVLGAIVLLMSGAFVAVYRTWFRLPAAIVPVHLLLVAGLLAVAMLAGAALQATMRRPRRIVVLPLALVTGTLALLDALSWFARSVWMDELSIETILFYAPRVVRVAAGATEVPGLVILGAVVGTGVVMLALVGAFSRPLAEALFHAVHPERLALFGQTRPVLGSALALGACLLLLGAGYRAIDPDGLHGEPLVGLRPQHRGRANRGATPPAVASLLRSGANAALARADDPPAVPVRRGRKNVVVVVIDSLRPDHLSSRGYGRPTTPTLDAFVAGAPAVVAEWATSSCSISSCGIMSILGSAQYWRQQAGVTTLPDVLGAAGYDLYFISSGDFSRGYPLLRTLFGSTARMFVDGFTTDRYAANDDRHIVDTLHEVPPYAGRPAFFYFHLHSLHRGGTKYREPAWRPALKDTRAWAALDRGERDPAKIIDDYTPTVRLNDYDNATLQADEVFAVILAALGERGYLDESVIVVTSDHGEALGEHGQWGHGHDLYAASIDVPLIVRDTTLGATRRVPYATHVDIAPTVADCLGLPAPAAWEGRSLLSNTPTDSFHQTTHPSPILAVIWRTARGTYKYVVDPKARSQALYELQADPGEETDVLATADPAIVAALRAALAANFATVLSGKPLP